MNAIGKFLFSLRKLFFKGKAEDDLKDEIEFHLEMSIENKIKAGMTPEEASKQAKIEFGGVEQVKENTRDFWGMRIVHNSIQDFRFEIRYMLKNKGFTTVIILTLTLCLGINSAMFSILNSILLRPYSLPSVSRIIIVGKQWNNGSVHGTSAHNYLDIVENADSYKSLGYCRIGERADLHIGSSTRRIEYDLVTPGVWSATGVQPIIGRLFTEDDLARGETDLAVISYVLAEQLYNKKGNALGSEIRLDDKTYRVIGIVPNDFYLLFNMSQVWIPKIFNERERSIASRNNNSDYIVARLKDGVSLDQARQKLKAIFAAYVDNHSEIREDVERSGENYGAVMLKDYFPNLVPIMRMTFYSMQGSGGFILLIGCLNVAGLILVRNYHRLHELAMRHTLGAGQARLISQLVKETVFVFLVAGLISIPVTWGILSLIDNSGMNFPTGLPNGINPAVLGFTFTILLTCGVVFGSLPAWYVLRRGLGTFLHEEGRTSSAAPRIHWLQNIFIVGQISLAMVLLISAGVLLRNARHLMNQDFGFETKGHLFANVFLPEYRYDDAREKIDPFRQKVLERIKFLPGVKDVALSDRAPLHMYYTSQSTFSVDGYDPGPKDPEPQSCHYRISEGYFNNMGIPLLQGRSFQTTDTTESPRVVIVSESLVRDHFMNRDAIGTKINFWGKDYSIVGVVGDTRDFPFYSDEPRHTLYFSYRQWGRHYGVSVFAVKTDLNPSTLKASVNKVIKEIDPDISAVDLFTMQENLRKAMMVQLMPAEITSVFAVVAVFMSVLGLYGVIAFSVTERKREFGIRIALGSDTKSIIRTILWWSGRLAFIGVILGLVGAFFLMRTVDALLPDIRTTAPDLFIVFSLLVFTTALVASYFPAKKATKIDLMSALRNE